MAGVVYILCAITSLICAIMLYNGFRQNKFRLLFWSSVGFLGFALNNSLLFVDLMIGPAYDLSIIRTIPAMVGLLLLIYGLISDTV